MANGRRLFDSLDLAALRHAVSVSVRDVIALVIIGVVVAAAPIVFTLLGINEDKR